MQHRSVLETGVLLALALTHCAVPDEPRVELRGGAVAEGAGATGIGDEAGGEAGDEGSDTGEPNSVCQRQFIESITAGQVPQVVALNDDDVAVLGASPLVCTKWSNNMIEVGGELMSVGDQACLEMAAFGAVEPEALEWTTWEEDGVLHCGCACVAQDPPVVHQYIWIANSVESTVSKIDTNSLVEVARYKTSHDLTANPSRTSVGLQGHAAIANRSGSVVKIYGDPSHCPDSNLNGVVDTSTGANDVLPWGADECMAWLTELPQYASQRPVAWTQDEKIWTSGSDGVSIDVLLLDGETGVVEEIVPIPGVVPSFYGLYGSATDAKGNFWGSQLGQGTLVEVDRETFAVQTWPMPISGYGMTVDPDGYVWTCSAAGVARFTASTSTWVVDTPQPGGGTGCMADGNGLLWLAGSKLVGIDRETFAVIHAIDLPTQPYGIGIDFSGNVWGVEFGSHAYRVEPGFGTVDTFTGLAGAYTYSDMTGFALASAGDTDAPTGPTCTSGQPCDTGLNGPCAAGTTQCTGGVLSCWQDIAPAPEDFCGNGVDDDCNGAVDDCGCSHDYCVVGDALDMQCDTCVMMVCMEDAWCCMGSWDAGCVDEVGTICGIAC